METSTPAPFQEGATTLFQEGATTFAQEGALASAQEGVTAPCPPTIPAVTPDYVLNGLREVVERCLQRSPATAPRGVQKNPAPGSVTESAPAAPETSPAGLWRFEPQAATRALELLGKHFGLFGKPAARDDDAPNSAPDATPDSAPDAELGFAPNMGHPTAPRTGVLVTPGLLTEDAWEKAARS